MNAASFFEIDRLRGLPIVRPVAPTNTTQKRERSAMASIRLTQRQIDAGVKRALKVFEKADTNKTGRVYEGEIQKYRGKGAAQLRKVFDYAQRVEGRGSEASLVKLTTVRSALNKLAGG